MAELQIGIYLELVQPGPNRRWRKEREVDIPPDYKEQDILPFVRHELERTVTELEATDLGEVRAAKIIAAYELRLRVIRHLLRRGPRTREHLALAALINEIADLSNDDLFARWGTLEEHVED